MPATDMLVYVVLKERRQVICTYSGLLLSLGCQFENQAEKNINGDSTKLKKNFLGAQYKSSGFTNTK